MEAGGWQKPSTTADDTQEVCAVAEIKENTINVKSYYFFGSSVSASSPVKWY